MQNQNWRERAADWIENNPRVFSLFEKFALSMAERQRKFGMKALAERVRWEVMTTWDKDADGYRVNNSIVAYIGRRLVEHHPSLKDYIEFRRCQDEIDGKPVFHVQAPPSDEYAS